MGRGAASPRKTRAAQEREKRRLANEDFEAITQKRCNICREVKDVEEFPVRKRKAKSGVVTFFPAYACRECECARHRAWEARKKEEEGDGFLARRRERWARRTAKEREKRRNAHREWATARRREKGIEGNGNGHPRKEKRTFIHVPVEPASVLLEVLEAEGFDRRRISRMSGVEERRLFDIVHLRTPSTHIDNVDRILVAFDRQDELEHLYPVEEAQEHLTGWGVIDPEGILEKYRNGA